MQFKTIDNAAEPTGRDNQIGRCVAIAGIIREYRGETVCKLLADTRGQVETRREQVLAVVAVDQLLCSPTHFPRFYAGTLSDQLRINTETERISSEIL